MVKKITKLILFILMNLLLAAIFSYFNFKIPSFIDGKPFFASSIENKYQKKYYNFNSYSENYGIPFPISTSFNACYLNFDSSGTRIPEMTICSAKLQNIKISSALIINYIIFFAISFFITNLIRKKIKQKNINQNITNTTSKITQTLKNKGKNFLDSF